VDDALRFWITNNAGVKKGAQGGVMTQGKRFCTGCGLPLAADDSFCGSCGKKAPVSSIPSTAPATPPPQDTYGELLLGIIPSVSRKKGMMGVEGFNIIVTRRRMIFALMTNEMMKGEAKKNSKGGGFLGGMLNYATIGYTFYKRYLNMTPDAALAENPQNFAVDLSQIKKVKIDAGKEITNYYTIEANRDKIFEQYQYEKDKLEIQTIKEKYDFELPGSSLGKAMDAIEKAGLA
jgi:hypothetical protein